MTPDNIRSFDKILERVDDDRSYSIQCSDNSTILFTTIDELLDFPNTNLRRIRRLICVAGDPDGAYASIEFNVPKIGSVTAEFTVKGEDDNTVSVSTQIEEQILRTKQWFSVLALGDVILKFFILFFLAAFFYGAFEYIIWWSEGFPRMLPEPVLVAATPGGVVVFYITVALMVIVAVALGADAIRGALFPMGEFAIGDGNNRIKAAGFWRRAVGGGVILAFGVTLIGNWISS